MRKYYAVRVGRDGASGIYDTWEQCRALVHGVPGAVYKSFPDRAQAEAFLTGAAAEAEKPGGEEVCVAYVDGSYNAATGEFACGAVAFWQGEQIEFSKRYDDRELAAMHNVAGEIMGAVTVIRWCLEQGIPAVEIHHDYQGIAAWAQGLWKANREGTRAYARFCQKAMERMGITFVKVKGHSGDPWNDRADALAKAAFRAQDGEQ